MGREIRYFRSEKTYIMQKQKQRQTKQIKYLLSKWKLLIMNEIVNPPK